MDRVLTCRSLAYIFYLFFEFSVLCYTWSSFYITNEEIATIHNTVIATFFRQYLPVQLIEFVVFIIVTVCFILNCCDSDPDLKPNHSPLPLPDPEPIDLSMASPLPVTQVHSTTFEEGEIYQPLLMQTEEENVVVEINPVEIPVPAIPFTLPSLPAELPIEPVEPHILHVHPSQIISVESDHHEVIIAEIAKIDDEPPAEVQFSDHYANVVPENLKEVIDELSKTIQERNDLIRCSNENNEDTVKMKCHICNEMDATHVVLPCGDVLCAECSRTSDGSPCPKCEVEARSMNPISC